MLLRQARQIQPVRFGNGNRRLVPGIGMAHDARARVIHQNARQAGGGLVCAIGHAHLTGMQAVAHAHAAAVVKAHPAGTTDSVQGKVEQGPVGYGIGGVFMASVSR